jgi:hypothetical protein
VHIVIRDGDVMIEIQAHKGETPRICAWLVGDDPNQRHLSATFASADHPWLGRLLAMLREVVAGARPQVEARQKRATREDN